MAVYRLVFNRTWKNVLLWAVTSIFTNTGRGAFLCAEIWSLKASVGRIAACACLCKFSSPFKSFVEFLSFSLTSIVSTGKERTIDSQHLFIFTELFWISLKLVIAKKYYICSHGVNFLQNSCWDLYLFIFSAQSAERFSSCHVRNFRERPRLLRTV